MTTTLRVLATALVLTFPLLVACGGDDDSGDSDGSGDAASSSSSASPSGAIDTPISPDDGGSTLPPLEGDPCRAEVSVTGAVEISWAGEGAVVLAESIAPTTYRSVDGENAVTVYAASRGFEEASIIFIAGAERFGTPGGATGMEVDPDGSGADVDTDLEWLTGDSDEVRVVATFSC